MVEVGVGGCVRDQGLAVLGSTVRGSEGFEQRLQLGRWAWGKMWEKVLDRGVETCSLVLWCPGY